MQLCKHPETTLTLERQGRRKEKPKLFRLLGKSRHGEIAMRKTPSEAGAAVGSPYLHLNLFLQSGWVSPPEPAPHEKLQVHLNRTRYSQAF